MEATQTSLTDLILATRDELRQTQVDLDFAIGLRAGATQRERQLLAELEDVKVAVTAALYREGLPGKNADERTAFLREQLLDNRSVRIATKAAAEATNERLYAEGKERAADTKHKALRVELAALGQLVAAG